MPLGLPWSTIRATFISIVVAGVAVAPVDATRGIVPSSQTDVVRSVPRETVARQLSERYPTTTPRAGGTVIMGDQAPITTLNVLLAIDTVTSYNTGLVFESLVAISPVDGTIVPRLADSYDIMLNPQTSSLSRTQLDAAVVTYRMVDHHTFEPTSEGRLATVLYNAAETVSIMPKHVWQSVPPADWSSDPGSTGDDPLRVIGTGPFRFERIDQTAATTWHTIGSCRPSIDRDTYRVVTDENAEVQALRTGEIDIYEGILGPQVADVLDDDGPTVETYDTLAFNYYTLNLDSPATSLFQQQEVRQALLLALDREAINDTVIAVFGEVAIGTQSRLSPAHAPERIHTRYPFDPERAVAVLATAGRTDSNGDWVGQELALGMLFPADSTTDQLAPYFHQAWSEIGVTMTPTNLPFDVLIADDGPLVTHGFQAVLIALRWNPDGGRGALFSSAAYEGGFNVAKYCNSVFEGLENRQLRELYPDRRREILIERANVVNDDLLIGALRFAVGRTAYNRQLQHFYPNNYSLLWSLPFARISTS